MNAAFKRPQLLPAPDAPTAPATPTTGLPAQLNRAMAMSGGPQAVGGQGQGLRPDLSPTASLGSRASGPFNSVLGPGGGQPGALGRPGMQQQPAPGQLPPQIPGAGAGGPRQAGMQPPPQLPSAAMGMQQQGMGGVP